MRSVAGEEPNTQPRANTTSPFRPSRRARTRPGTRTWRAPGDGFEAPTGHTGGASEVGG